jgi:dinuclear metal center YbgI/SA1388 family protein
VPALLDDILTEADRLLEPKRFEDYCLNGLQVPARPSRYPAHPPAEIRRIATGVSAHAELFELAAEHQAQLLLVHHGVFWGSGIRHIDAPLRRRLQLLFDADIALAAYHLPLDAHPEFGNNALLAKAIADKITAGTPPQLEPFAPHKGTPIGFIATFAPNPGVPARELFQATADVTARTPLVFDAGPAQVKRLAIVSGAGADYLPEAASAHADALLTGEAPERAMAEARELNLHLIAAGHYATETFGINALGEHLAARFDLEHVFLDVPNPI